MRQSIIFKKEYAKKLFFGIVLLKLIGFSVFAELGFPALYQVSDANSFHNFANGLASNVDKNPWAHFLRFLNDIGVYSRFGLATIFFLISCLLLPWQLAVVLTDGEKKMQTIDWVALICLSIYPTLTFYSTDIYREVVMVALFLVAIRAVQKLLKIKTARDISLQEFSVPFLFLGILLILRMYLAASIVLAFAVSLIIECKKRPWFILLGYIFSLWLADQLGVFDTIKGDYRKPYEMAGSHYGIDYARDPFLVGYIKSFFFSVYGLHFSSVIAYAFFIVESIPALVASAYIVLNRRSADRFVNFLIIFFFVYAAAWNVGVDALGTAVRYRIFNYLAILTVAILIYKRSKNAELAMGGS